MIATQVPLNSPMPDKKITVSLPRLHVNQQQIWNERDRFNVICNGRRWGKTKMGIWLAARGALDGLPVGWFAPEFKYLLEPWQELKTRLAPVASRVSEQERCIYLITGGKVEFWSLSDPDAGRSRKYGRVIVDEAGMVANLNDIWNKAIRPTLTDLRGDLWTLSTPKGRNFFWQMFRRGDHTEGSTHKRKGWKSWTMPTLTNPCIPGLKEEIEEARNELPERVFRQEYLAEFLDDAGGVFTGVRAVLNPNKPVFLEATNSWVSRGELVGPFNMGVDVARVNDFTVITVFDGNSNQVYLRRFQGHGWERQCDIIVEAAKLFPGVYVTVDATGMGDPIPDMLLSRNLMVNAFKISGVSKPKMIDSLAMKIERKEITLLNVSDQTDEFVAYEYQVTPSGRYTTNAPEGMHDDCVIAVALANTDSWGTATYIGGRTSNNKWLEEDEEGD